jgi:putative resolvase
VSEATRTAPESGRGWQLLPVPVQKVGRLILVSAETASAGVGAGGVGLYARVSSHDQKADLDRQVARLSSWAAQAGLPVVRVESEVGSGISGARAKVRRLLADPKVTTMVVEHRDRLGRNTELVDVALSAHERRLVVLDDGDVDDDLVGDMVEVLTWLCARLYGRRSARNRALKALGCAQRNIGPKIVRAQGQDSGHG